MVDSINFDNYTIDEIDQMIADGVCTEKDVASYYNNEWWRDNI